MKVIKQSEVNQSLMSKFPEEDIEKASKTCKARAEQIQMFMRIACRQDCYNCPHQSDAGFISPSGTIGADTMFVFLKPDDEDAFVHAMGFGPSSRFLTMMLDKFKTRPQDAYITTLAKCNGTKATEAAKICLSHFFLDELHRVQPKRVILFGEETSEIVREAIGLDHESFDDIEGVTFPHVYQGHRLDILSLKSPQDVLTKNGTLFKSMRKDIWQGLKSVMVAG